MKFGFEFSYAGDFFASMDFSHIEKMWEGCIFQEILLVYARSFVSMKWVMDNLLDIPALIKAEIEALPAKIHAALEAAIQKMFTELNAKTGGDLPIPELTAEWAWNYFLSSPFGKPIDIAIFMWGKMPSKEDYWNIESLIDTMYNPDFN